MTLTFLKIIDELFRKITILFCLMIPHDEIQVMYFWQEYHRSDAPLPHSVPNHVQNFNLSHDYDVTTGHLIALNFLVPKNGIIIIPGSSWNNCV